MRYTKVYHDPSSYVTFPSVVCTADNKVIVAFREAGSFSVNAAKSGRPTHHDTDSRCCIIFSADGGETFYASAKKVVTDIDFGINDPGLTILSSGSMILRTSAIEVKPSSERKNLDNQILAHRPELGTVSAVAGLTIQFSDDTGLSWSSPEFIEIKGTSEKFVSREPVVELEDGSFILSVYKSKPTQVEEAYLIRSYDRGKTWEDISLIAKDERGKLSMFQGTNFNETAVLDLGSGKLLAAVRGDSSYYTDDAYMPIGGVGELLLSFSDNAGFSWSYPKPSGIWGQPAHLLKLQNGDILCTYGYRKQPYSIKACISKDGGKTWDLSNTVTIKENCPSWDMGYPASAQRPDGKIITVYYWIDNDGIRYIEAAIWEVKPV